MWEISRLFYEILLVPKIVVLDLIHAKDHGIVGFGISNVHKENGEKTFLCVWEREVSFNN